MGSETGIAWTDHTWNAWWGCDEVSPGCDLCYARVWAERQGKNVWGPNAERWYMTTAWKNPAKWNGAAQKRDAPALVFSASMSDLFETPPPIEQERMTIARDQLLRQVIPATPWLTWQLLTKRPHNIERMVPSTWIDRAWPRNVWPGTSAENQEMLELRIRRMDTMVRRCTIPPPVVWFSIEPMIGSVDFWHVSTIVQEWQQRGIAVWAIFGGESDIGAAKPGRELDLLWIWRALHDCAELGIIPFMKQLGSAAARRMGTPDRKGETPSEWPEWMQVRRFPAVWHPGRAAFVPRISADPAPPTEIGTGHLV